MNLYVKALADHMTGRDVNGADWAWISDTDNLDNVPDGTTGPSDAPAHMVAWLTANTNAPRKPFDLKGREVQVFRFRLYDDDGELYYTGRLMMPADVSDHESACYAPLGDYGPGSGCVRVDYEGHPEMNCG